jgi:hypothetical protein
VARKATVGRQPSRCVFGTDPWRDFMAAEVHGLRVDHNGLFTTVEHAVLANWFDQRRPLSLRTSSGTTHSLSLALIPRRRGRARCQAPSGRGPWRCSSVSGLLTPPSRQRADLQHARHLAQSGWSIWSSMSSTLRSHRAEPAGGGATRSRDGSWRNPLRRARSRRLWRAAMGSRRSICRRGAGRREPGC